jgi:hypothetical protein
VAHLQDNARPEGKKSGIAVMCRSEQRAVTREAWGGRLRFAHLEIMEMHLSVEALGKLLPARRST